MSLNIQDSIFLITSTNLSNDRFGTGFMIHIDENGTYIVTCAHVIDEVDGSIQDKRPVCAGGYIAQVIASGDKKSPDLAVLRIDEVLTRRPLDLSVSGHPGAAFETAGWSKGSGKQYVIKSLQGELVKPIGLSLKRKFERVNAWTLNIIDEDDAERLERGYSGSPVFEKMAGSVSGVISDRRREGKGGLAISIEELEKIWPEIPPGLIKRKSAAADEIQTDWGEAPEVNGFVGRVAGLSELKYWVVEKHSRVVIVTGLGGIGKTSLTVTLANQIKNNFHYLFWRSLQNAPPVEEILKGCIQFLSDSQKVDLPSPIDAQISMLIEFLRAKRCLLVFDNLETVLQDGGLGDLYQEEYEGYERLIERVAQTNHQSCLLLTSREKPKSFKQLEGKHSPVESLQVEGIDQKEGLALLKYYGILAEESERTELIRRSGGNPMALKLASTTIDDWYGGDVTAFLEESGAVLDDIRPLLEQHLARLSELGLVTMYWLAIERDMISRADLAKDILYWLVVKSGGTAAEDLRSTMVTEVSIRDFRITLLTLYRHSLIEKRGVYFTLQPVIMDHLTEKIIEQVIDEILTGQVKFLQSHALMKAQAKEYIRQSQTRLILRPIIERLLAKPGVNKLMIKVRLAEILSAVRVKMASSEAEKGRAQIVPGYIGGNTLNLLLQMDSDVQGLDFSGIAVWQSYLKGARLSDVNFAGADLSRSVFTETFGRVFSIGFSPDGELFAIGTENGEIRLWQFFDGQPLHIFKKHKTRVRSLAFSPDGKKLASGSFDQTVRLWDLNTGKCLQVLGNDGHLVWSVAFSPDGKNLASAHQDKVIRIWDVKKGKCLKTLHGHDREVRVVVFSSDNHTVISGSSDKTVRIWNLSTGTCIKILEGHIDGVWSVVCYEGKIIVSGGSGTDRTLRLWDLPSGKSKYILQGHEGWVLAVAISPDGQTIASGSSDCTVRLWETETGRWSQTLLGHTAPIWSLAFSPDGETLSSGSEDQSVRVWDIRTGRCLKIIEGYSNLAWSVAFSPNGQRLVGGYTDGALRVWDVVSGKLCSTLYGHKKGVRSVAISPDGRTLASGSEDCTVRLWDMETKYPLRTLEGHTDWVMAVAFSPAGDILVSGSSDQSVRLWRIDKKLQEQQAVKKIPLDTILVRSIAFDPRGDKLAVGSGNGIVQLRKISSGRFRTLSDHTGWVMSVTYSADGEKIASGSNDGTVRWYDFGTGNKTVLPHSSAVLAVALSPAGKILASGSVDHIIQLWDVNDSQMGPPSPPRVLNGHIGAIRSLAFDPAGNILASSSDDETIRLWSVQTGLWLKTLRIERPYERMNIARVTGLTESQKLALKDLGAVELND